MLKHWLDGIFFGKKPKPEDEDFESSLMGLEVKEGNTEADWAQWDSAVHSQDLHSTDYLPRSTR